MSVNVLKSNKKNYLRFVEKSATTHSSGATYSVDSDGVITLNGTTSGSTSTAYTPFSYYLTLPAGDYTFTSLNQNDKVDTHQLYMVFQDGTGNTRGTGSLNRKGTTTFTLTQTTTLRVYFFFYGGNTYNNTKLYPMIIEGTYTYDTVPSFVKSVGRLPSEYQEVEYIEGTGTQYIDTGVNPTNDYGIKVVVSNLTEKSQDFNYLGARTQSVRFAINYYRGKHGYGWGNFYTTNETFNVNEKTTVALNYNNSGKFNVNGNDIDTLPSTTISGLPTILIFAQNTLNGAQIHKYRIYNVSITNGVNLVRKFIPCYRKSDNVAGLYDTVNDEFYTNSGTGSFVIGGIVVGYDIQKCKVNILTQGSGSNLPAEYQEVEYLSSTGTQYINTGFTPNSDNVRLNFDVSFNSTADQRFCGSNKVVVAMSGSYTGTLAIRKGGQWVEGGWSETITTNTKTNFDISISSSQTIVKKDDVTMATYSSGDSLSGDNTFLLFVSRYAPRNYLYGNLYSFKIYAENVLVRDYVPCYRKSDNVIGMYDLANGVFYTNAGTGTFAKGNDKPYQVEKFNINVLKKTDNLLKINRIGWNSTSYQPTNTVVFDYDRLYYMASSGYIRPKDNSLNETITQSSVTFTQTGSSWWGIGFPFEVKPNTKYTIGAKRTDGNKTKIMYALYNADGSFASYAQVTTNTNILDMSLTITTGANTKTMIIVVAGTTQGNTIYAYDLQVEEGQTRTDFKPYGYEIMKI